MDLLSPLSCLMGVPRAVVSRPPSFGPDGPSACLRVPHRGYAYVPQTDILEPMERPRVLIVDDDEGIRDALRDLLAEEGFDITGVAHNGVQAVTMAATDPPDVVLMDLRMPGMDGISAARMIRDEDAIIQVVVLSAYDDPGFTQNAEDAGVYAYLVKGCPAGLMCDVIRQAWKLKKGLEERRDTA